MSLTSESFVDANTNSASFLSTSEETEENTNNNKLTQSVTLYREHWTVRAESVQRQVTSLREQHDVRKRNLGCEQVLRGHERSERTRVRDDARDANGQRRDACEV